MNKTTLRIALFFAAVAVCGTALYFKKRPKEPVVSPSIEARLELASGSVLVRQGDAESRGTSGMPLKGGSRIETSLGARAMVRLPDGARLFVRGKSEVALTSDGVELRRGEVWVDAPPQPRQAIAYHAGGLALSAADTSLSLNPENDRSEAYVARGMAAVTSPGGRVEVNAGERAVVAGSDAPAVSPVAYWEDWTGGMADYSATAGSMGAGAGRIYAVDPGASAGTPAMPLQVDKQAVRAVVRGALSETEVDQTFFNPNERDVEGWYWFSIPEGASVTGFAVETDGNLVEGEFIEQRQAASQYAEARDTGHAPAILEWVDGRAYRARIYPVPAGGARRVVLRYVELRPVVSNRVSYVYPMASDEPTPARIGEFSLAVDLGEAGEGMKISTLAEARIEENGRRVTMRRSGYTPRADFQLEAELTTTRPSVSYSRYSPGSESADYVMVRYSPDIDWQTEPPPSGTVVVVVDTSAAGDEAQRQLKARTAEAILKALSDEDRFALVSLDVRPKVLHPEKGLASAKAEEIAKALEKLAEHDSGGATDLTALFDVGLGRLHGAEQPALVYVGDGIATSGELSGERVVENLRRALGTSRARLFTVGVGTEADHGLLGELARSGGGQVFRVDDAKETTLRSLELVSALKTPTVTDLEIDLGAGMDEVFSTANGKVSRGSEVFVLARTHHEIPSSISVRGRFAGKPFEKEYATRREDGPLAAFVPRLWASEYVKRLLGIDSGPESQRGRIAALGIEYGLVTPYSSLLALESEAAYAQMGINRRHSPLRGGRLSHLGAQASLERRSETMIGTPAKLAFGCDAREPAPAEATEAAESKPAFVEHEKGTYAPSRAVAPPPPQGVPAPEPAADLAAGAVAEELAEEATELEPLEKSMKSSSVSARSGGGLGALANVPGRKARVADEEQPKDDAIAKVTEDGALGPRTCSDAAARPLWQRVVLWRKRLRTAQTPEDLIARYDSAVRACEVGDWLAERTLLRLLQARIDTPDAATRVLSYFGRRRDVQRYIAQRILRRSVDKELVQAVERALYGNADWNLVDIALSELPTVDARIAALRERIAQSPDDPEGQIRLVTLLSEAGRATEAVSAGERLRSNGVLTPLIARRLGDVLARAGQQEAAIRTYSEIVEFDPENAVSRQLLGDVYLRHGWYDAAYRQYKTLLDVSPEEATGWLRLAAAASGAGRTDEALRIERRVATTQGNPGVNDPRKWARLHSAARLAWLMSRPASDSGRRESLERELKELGLLPRPSTLVVVTWEDLERRVRLQPANNQWAGEYTDAAPVGLSAVLYSPEEAKSADLVALLDSPAGADTVKLRHCEITWDGSKFRTRVAGVSLDAEHATKAL